MAWTGPVSSELQCSPQCHLKSMRYEQFSFWFLPPSQIRSRAGWRWHKIVFIRELNKSTKNDRVSCSDCGNFFPYINHQVPRLKIPNCVWTFLKFNMERRSMLDRTNFIFSTAHSLTHLPGEWLWLDRTVECPQLKCIQMWAFRLLSINVAL